MANVFVCVLADASEDQVDHLSRQWFPSVTDPAVTMEPGSERHPSGWILYVIDDLGTPLDSKPDWPPPPPRPLRSSGLRRRRALRLHNRHSQWRPRRIDDGLACALVLVGHPACWTGVGTRRPAGSALASRGGEVVPSRTRP